MREFLKKLIYYTGFPISFYKVLFWELKMFSIRIYNLVFQQFFIRKIYKKETVLLNFGCGLTHYENWIGIDSFFNKNVDFVLDLRRKLPFKDNSIDHCHSEHFFEHLNPTEGIFHLKEVNRILKKEGRYRIVVPHGVRFMEKYINDDTNFFLKAHPWVNNNIDALYSILNWDGSHKNFFDFKRLKLYGEKTGFSKINECNVNDSDISLLNIDIDKEQRILESLYVEFTK
jgi:predicted SAM-dependent methyltransferase